MKKTISIGTLLLCLGLANSTAYGFLCEKGMVNAIKNISDYTYIAYTESKKDFKRDIVSGGSINNPALSGSDTYLPFGSTGSIYLEAREAAQDAGIKITISCQGSMLSASMTLMSDYETFKKGQSISTKYIDLEEAINAINQKAKNKRSPTDRWAIDLLIEPTGIKFNKLITSPLHPKDTIVELTKQELEAITIKTK